MSIDIASISSLLEPQDTAIEVAPTTAPTPARRKRTSSKPRSKENIQAANQAIRAGAKTDTQRILESDIQDHKTRIATMDKTNKVRAEQERLESLYDRLGNIPPEKLLTEQGFQMVKTHFPEMTKQKFVNEFAKTLYRRKKAVNELAKIPEGTELPANTQKQLAEVGISNPKKHMNIWKGFSNAINATVKTAGKIVGGVAKAGVEAALITGKSGVGGGFNPFLAVGKESIRREEARTEQAEVETEALQTTFKNSLAERKLLLDTRKLDLNAIKAQISNAKDNVAREDKLRSEFNKFNKRFEDISIAKNKVSISLNLKTAAGDLAGIFSYMKILDPGSTVREGEFANAENSRGVPDTVRNLYNKTREGLRLGPQQRKEFIAASDSLFTAEKDSFDRGKSRLTDIAKNRKLNLENIFGKERKAPAPPAKKQNNGRPTKRLSILGGNKVNFNGTNEERKRFTERARAMNQAVDRDPNIPKSRKAAAKKALFENKLLKEFSDVVTVDTLVTNGG